jgi:murein DD-endopeptidase MepM/ murein hydrolase activator NlpD
VRALLPLNGKYALAQRFAIDWEQLGADNRLVRDPNKMKDVTNYNIYGQPVLAVADGTIVARRNDLPDEIPGELPKDMTLDRADGNYVVMKLGDQGPYALYAHMQKGSVTDKTRVKPGDVLGKVGNSGNSSAPHLHFQLMDDASPLRSDGLPYLLDSFVLTGMGDSTDDFDRAERDGVPMKLTPMEPRRIKEAMPMDLMVVDFGN